MIKFNQAAITGRTAVFLATGLSLSLGLAHPVHAQDGQDFERWAVTLNATQVFVKEDAPRIDVAGGPIPGANVRIGNATTITGDVGYFFTPNVAANLFVGVPAQAKIEGVGAIEPLGTLAKTKYGPLILSAQYHFNSRGSVRPYLGVGIGRVLFLGKQDGALTGFEIADSWAPAAQVGVRAALSETWMLNADVRYVPFSADVTANLGAAPVDARLDIQPVLTSVGLTYRF